MLNLIIFFLHYLIFFCVRYFQFFFLSPFSLSSSFSMNKNNFSSVLKNTEKSVYFDFLPNILNRQMEILNLINEFCLTNKI